jgi:hypothetical protein
MSGYSQWENSWSGDEVKRRCDTVYKWTYRTEPAITRNFRYRLVRKAVTPALSGIRDGRNREGNTPIIGRIDLF